MDQVFSGLVAQGVGLWLGFQTFINIGVNLGALPTKGLTLPLMSYGGSSLLVCAGMIAVVQRIDLELKRERLGIKTKPGLIGRLLQRFSSNSATNQESAA